MLKRVRSTRIGDVFSVPIDEQNKRYMQYIVSDLTQLNSDVIRAFKKVYSIDENPSIEDIIDDEVDFYAHTDTKTGIKKEYWIKIGNSSNVGDNENIIFKAKMDFRPIAKDESDWFIWKVNGPLIKNISKKEVSKLNAELGLVFSTNSLLTRLKTGKYPGVYADL